MSAIDGFVAGFFGEGNHLEKEDLHVVPLVESARNDWPRVPLALPRTGDARAGASVRWYVVSPNASEDARVAEEITAWIGPTYSGSWKGQPTALDAADPIDRAVMDLDAGSTFVVDVSENDRSAVRLGLERLRALWAERPVESGDLEQRTSELVRDLRLSVSSGNPETARETLAELRRRGLLTAENELFLEVVVLEAEESWEQIAAHRHLGDLSARRRPWPVTRALIRALYRRVLVGAESADDLDSWVELARQLEMDYPGVFATRGPIDAPEVGKAFALIDRNYPERPLRTRMRVLAARGLSAQDRAFLEGVVGTVEKSRPEDSFQAIQTVSDNGGL